MGQRHVPDALLERLPGPHPRQSPARRPLVFVRPLARGSAYHSMVYLGNGLVVYHTGYAPQEGGEVRLVSLQTLGKHPQKYWHPRPDNPHFLGFYRWKIASD